jgi:ATP-binding cassette subfamily F protein 3
LLFLKASKNRIFILFLEAFILYQTNYLINLSLHSLNPVCFQSDENQIYKSNNSMITVNDISVQFGGTTLFSDVSFAINENDKIALMGKNGAGKSTLLKIIAGQSKPSTGNISAPKEAVVAYLPQHLLATDGATVVDEASKAFGEIFGMKADIDAINEQLTIRTDYESDAYMKLIERVSDLSEKFYAIEEVNYEAEVEKILLGLGFLREDFTRQTTEFSGGWRMRIELAKILLQKPDLILLDEPTNHMDIESIQWLEDFLINSAKAVVVISHDKTFVDNITNRTIEVTMGRIYDYKAKYSHYLELRKDRRVHQQKAYDEQQRMIADNRTFIDRFKGTFSKTDAVQSRVKMLEKLVIVQVDEVDNSSLKLKFSAAVRSGQYPVIVKELSKAYGDHVVFKDANIVIERGEKVAFVGKNGEGKSTMIKAIMKEIDIDTGSLEIGHNAKVGYFAQNQASLLNGNATIFETIDDIAVGDVRTKIKDILGAFMFHGDDITKKVKVLSGGEKTRLAMIKLLLEPVNLLILDEPSNHLDMKTKDIIKDALRDFEGTLILVSHDRDFLDGLATKVFEFGNKRVVEHFEDIAGFLAHKKMSSMKEIEK